MPQGISMVTGAIIEVRKPPREGKNSKRVVVRTLVSC